MHGEPWPDGAEGREARGKVGELLDAMKHGREVVWSTDRRHVFADGSSLQLEVEREPRRWLGGPGHTRAVLRDDHGVEIDASEWFADPGARLRTPLERLRVLVDEYVALHRNS